MNKDNIIRIILGEASEYFGISLEDMQSKRQFKEIILARKYAMQFMKEFIHPALSLGYIGSKVGGLNHATVLYHLRTLKNEIERYDYYRISYQELKRVIHNNIYNAANDALVYLLENSVKSENDALVYLLENSVKSGNDARYYVEKALEIVKNNGIKIYSKDEDLDSDQNKSSQKLDN